MRSSADRRSDVIVIGGGQAGLAVSHELERRSVDHLVLERDRVGASWAGLWESFRLNTPSWSTRLPGMPYDGDEPDGFMSRGEVVAHLERYASTLCAPLREGIGVSSLEPDDAGLRLDTTEGAMAARCVVVCTGAYQRAFRPAWVDALPAWVTTFDTRSYRDPESLPDGDVLVVGGGQSGMQIAEDLRGAGREVTLSCGKAPWAPRRIAGRDLVWWALETGFMDGTLADLPSPAARLTANVTASGVDGGHDLHARVLRAQGVTLAGRVVDADRERISFHDDLGDSVAWADARYADFRRDVEALCRKRGMDDPGLAVPEPFDAAAPPPVEVRELGAVIVAGGFRPDYGWIRVPELVDDLGFPRQVDGVSTAEPRLFFAGVHFLRTRKSSLLCGVADDAGVVADGVVRALGSRAGDYPTRAMPE